MANKEKQEYDYEGDMAMSQLKSIIANAQRMHDMLEVDTNLPEWVQSKITLAEDYITTAANYMQGEMSEDVVRAGTLAQRTQAYRADKAKKAGANLKMDPDTGTPDHFTAAARRKKGLKEAGSKQHIEVTHTTGQKSKKPVHPDNAFKALNHYRGLSTTKSARIVSEESKLNKEVQINELSKTTLKSYMNKADTRTMDRTIDNPKAHKKSQNRTMGIEKAGKKVAEEVAVNSAGAGNIAGIGVGPDGEPGVKKKKKNVMSFNRFMKK